MCYCSTALVTQVQSFRRIPSLCNIIHQRMAGSDSSGFPGFGTDTIHVGQDPNQWKSGAVIPPISLSTTFKQTGPGEYPGGYDYSRGGNPTRDCLEKCFAAVEGGKFALAFSSGLGATMSICHLLKSGDHIVAMDDLYGGTNRYFRRILANMGVETTFADATSIEKFSAAMRPNTKLVWIETPTNPLLRLVDIPAVVAVARKQKDVLVVVDNTFATPYFQRPLDLGADISMSSATKYINGHGDVVMGLTAMNDEALYKRLHFTLYAGGACPSAFDCYLVNRGMKTLHVRMKEHFRNAMAVANHLKTHPRVESVIYPGLPEHPHHELYKRQMKGFSGMVTFKLKGNLENATKFLQTIKVFTLAESLGGFESLVDHPALMTHASVPPEQRKELGIDDTLLRLSVGLEDTKDIIEDLDQALAAAVPDSLL
ncbi:cystathionine gamma-lyase-like isoform X2 [Apostichopus japonicus]|uniref:cystathionine gamma-lyase-like isoform X2 n=1 Tax=Stichopus japonicus TaxID=307972 RepID=UPI003AB6F487